jgi:hypothetical protein
MLWHNMYLVCYLLDWSTEAIYEKKNGVNSLHLNTTKVK